MQQIFIQLSVLVVLTGVSVAVVQYLFTNHQAHLKDFITSLKNINFDENNDYDKELEKQWENAVAGCKQHTYFINPNSSILFGFGIIAFLILFYTLASISTFDIINVNIIKLLNVDIIKFLNFFILIVAILLLFWVVANLVVLRQIFVKEALIKSEFDEIEKQHQLVDKVLNKK